VEDIFLQLKEDNAGIFQKDGALPYYRSIDHDEVSFSVLPW
jgi:hypothetical protein